MHSRKPWQHDFEEISEAQFSLFVKTLGWTVDRFGRDYGEDLNIRIFKQGNPTGHDFYVQLKGTDDVQQYALKKQDHFSYSVDVDNLQQWKGYTWPVIFVLWDIKQNIGYWLHMQPFIEQSVESDPSWLMNPRGAKKSKRKIHIPCKQAIRDQDVDLLRNVIDAEYEKISLSQQNFKEIQKQREETLKRTLTPQLEPLVNLQKSIVFPPRVRQQIRITEYEAAIAAHPANIEALLGLAEVYYELNELDKALVTINRAWELDSKDIRLANVRACILAEYVIAKGEPKRLLHEAIALFSSIRDKIIIPGVVDYNIGNCYAGLGEHQKAIEYYDQALSANPDTAQAAQIWKNRGTSFFYLGNYGEEIRSYEQAIELEPNLYQAYASWAATELYRGNYEQAETLFTKAFQVMPDIEAYDYPQLYSFAYALWRTGKTEEAHRQVSKVLAMKPEHKDGLVLKEYLLSELWESDSMYIPIAMAFFKGRLLDDPNDMFARNELYWIYNSQGYADDARLALEEAVRLDSVPPDLLYRYGLLLEAEQKFFESIPYLEAAYAQSQEHHIVHALARLKEETGDYQRAINLYILALHEATDLLPILHSIANCFHFLGNYKECIRITSVALNINPRDEISWSNLIYSFHQLGLGEDVLIFTSLARRLRRGRDIDDESANTALRKLMALIRTEFGEEFTQAILSFI